MDIMAKNFYKSYDNLIYIKARQGKASRNTMHKRESIRILYVVHLFYGRGRKRVPIDIIKARQVARAVKLNGVVFGLG